jgi:hypothetical protein
VLPKFNRDRKVFGIPVKLPVPPPHKEIDNHKKKIKDQRFEPPVVPDGFNLDDPSEEDIEFIDREWDS